MTNLLERAINTDDSNRAARSPSKMRWVSRAMKWRTIASRKRGRRIVNNGQGSSAIG